MSGGSYDYASREMEDGRLDKALANLDFALADLARLASTPVVQTYETEVREFNGKPYRVGVPRPVTDAEQLLTEMAIGALRSRLDRFAASLRSASTEAKAMAVLFHRLEWLRSGDDSDDTFQRWAREWATSVLESTRTP